MNREIASTLDELERKLHELERTLTQIGSREIGSRAIGSRAIGSREAGSREAGSRAPAGGDGAPDQGTGEAGRLVDEAVETQPEAGQPPRGAAPTPRARGLQGAASGYGKPPTAAELLRFRERLERTARELTHDYDELLGRLSTVEPAPAGPAISFARGAPSLDIIDVAGLRAAAARAFDSDPAGTTAYGTSIGYPRLRAWIADRHGVSPSACW